MHKKGGKCNFDGSWLLFYSTYIFCDSLHGLNETATVFKIQNKFLEAKQRRNFPEHTQMVSLFSFKESVDGNRIMSIWYYSMCKSHISGYDGNSGLLLDDCKCHRSAELEEAMENDRDTRYVILLQTWNVGTNKSLQYGVKKKLSEWKKYIHASLLPEKVQLAPRRKDIPEWLKESGKWV